MTDALVEAVNYAHCRFQLLPRCLYLAHLQQLLLSYRVGKYAEHLIRVEILLEILRNVLVLCKRHVQLRFNFFFYNDADLLFLLTDELFCLPYLNAHVLLHFLKMHL